VIVTQPDLWKCSRFTSK